MPENYSAVRFQTYAPRIDFLLRWKLEQHLFDTFSSYERHSTYKQPVWNPVVSRIFPLYVSYRWLPLMENIFM